MCCDKTKCERPEELKGNPEDCSREQVGKCHGDAETHSCAEPADCEHPERLRGKPGDCTPEQIRECHGDPAGHQCESK